MFIPSGKNSSGEQDEATLGRSHTNKGGGGGDYSSPQNVAGQKGCPQAKAGRGATWMTMEDGEGSRGGTSLCPCHSCLMPMKNPGTPLVSEWLCFWLPTLSPLYCHEQWDQGHISNKVTFNISLANRESITLKEYVPVKTVLF